VVTVAERRHEGVGIYAWSRSSAWRSQRGMCSDPAVILLHPSLPKPKANVLISHNGHACISDFGQLAIAPNQSSDISSPIVGGTYRWMSPELLHPESFDLESHPTKQSDCYALGMVIYETLSGRAPFAPYHHFAVILKVLQGERPERPQGEEGVPFTDTIWGVLELCWKHQPSERIDANAVLLCLEGIPYPLRSPSGVDSDAETDPDDQPDAIASDPCMSSPLRLRLIVNNPCAIIGLPSARGGTGVSASPNIPPRAESPTIPPREGSSKEGLVHRLARNVRNTFKGITR